MFQWSLFKYETQSLVQVFDSEIFLNALHCGNKKYFQSHLATNFNLARIKIWNNLRKNSIIFTKNLVAWLHVHVHISEYKVCINQEVLDKQYHVIVLCLLL